MMLWKTKTLNYTTMKNEKLVEVINEKILELEKDLESLFYDERWEFEILGQIEALSWVLEKLEE